MQEKLKNGEALDVTVIGSPVEGQPGVWKLESYLEGLDYCDGNSETWIYSIGFDPKTNEFFAASDYRFVENPAFVCVWLR